MRCPSCWSSYSRASHTYPEDDEVTVFIKGKRVTFIRRRRVCVHCGTVFWTKEMRETDLKESD